MKKGGADMSAPPFFPTCQPVTPKSRGSDGE